MYTRKIKVYFFYGAVLGHIGHIYDLFGHIGGLPMTKKGHIYDQKIILKDDQMMTYL